MNMVLLSVRTVHVLLGAIWFGIVVLLSLFLMPAVGQAGPGAGAVLNGLMKRKFDAFMASIAGLTVLTGIWLYWKYTNGFDPAIAGSMRARIVGVGGVIGVICAILGGSVVARSMKRSIAAMNAGQMEEALRYRTRADGAARLVAVLLLIAIVCMAFGAHYA